MSKLTKATVIAAGICIGLGLGLLTAGKALGGETGYWIDRTGIYSNQDIRERSEEKLYTMKKTQLDSFSSIDVLVDNCSIEVLPSDDGSYYMEYRIYADGQEPGYHVENGTLVMKCVREENYGGTYGAGFLVWNTGSTFERGSVKIYVPHDIRMKLVRLANSDADIDYDGPDADTYDFTSQFGAVNLKDGKASSVVLNASDGNITCESIKCDELTLNNNFGRSELSDISAKNITINSDDGKIFMKRVTAGSVSIVNTFGGLDGKVITADSFYANMSDGSCSLKNADLKNAVFENTFGIVAVELTGSEQDYNYNLSTTFGTIDVGGSSCKAEEGCVKDNNAERILTVKAGDGDIKVSFTE